MKEGWIKVFASNDLIEAKLAEDVLKQHGIESHILSKPDSVLPPLGQAELFTLPDKAESALMVLRQENILKE